MLFDVSFKRFPYAGNSPAVISQEAKGAFWLENAEITQSI